MTAVPAALRAVVAIRELALREAIARDLIGRAYAVAAVTEAEAAWAAHLQAPASLAVLDADGLETCRRIRGAPRGAPATVLIVLPSATSAAVERVLAEGADDWLLASLDAAALRLRLGVADRMVRRRLAERAERDFLETRLRESVKLEALAALATGIANDFNNALAAISGSIELAWMQLEPGQQPALHELAVARDAGRRAARLVRRLVNCVNPTPSVLRPIDPRAFVGEAVAVLRREVDPLVSVETHFDHGDWRVRGDFEQLTDLLLNLGYNARDAIAGEGRIRIATARATAEADGLPAGALGAHQFVRIDVTDTGHGIPRDVLPRIFEPLFTTKEAGHGAGLGLATAYRVLQQHGGGIAMESRVPGGTTVRMYLPRTEEALGPSLTSRHEPRLRGTETILLVDNEVDIRHPMREALEHFGYAVLEASDGVEGLTTYEREAARIDLVVLDVVMPGRSGWEVLAELKRRDPLLPVMLVSGFAPRESAPTRTAQLADAFLPKPYALSDLVRAVRSLLDARRKDH